MVNNGMVAILGNIFTGGDSGACYLVGTEITFRIVPSGF